MSKLIFSPSKEMTTSDLSLDCDPLSKESKNVLEELTHLSKEELAQVLKIKGDTLEEVFQYYHHAPLNKGKAAIDLYNGLAYRQIDKSGIDPKYLNDHLVILSALYGPILANTIIHPYRLDFNSRLKIDTHSLKQYWKPLYQEYFKREKVYNLASEEFASLLRGNDDIQLIDIEFYTDSSQSKKAPSATAKKLRGQLLSHLLKEESVDNAVFATFTSQGYQLNQIEDNRIVYIKHDK